MTILLKPAIGDLLKILSVVDSGGTEYRCEVTYDEDCRGNATERRSKWLSQDGTELRDELAMSLLGEQEAARQQAAREAEREELRGRLWPAAEAK